MIRRQIHFPQSFLTVFPVVWIFVFFSLLSLDLATKKWITSKLNFPDHISSKTYQPHSYAAISATKNGLRSMPLLGENGQILTFRLVFNDKFAFGSGPELAGGWGILLGFSVTLLATLLLFFYRWLHPDLGNQWAWAMVFAGAGGNLIDKMFVKSLATREWIFSFKPIAGHATGVVDFIEFIWFDWREAPIGILQWHNWPVFNLADSLVVIGMIVLIFTMDTKTKKLGKQIVLKKIPSKIVGSAKAG